MTQAEYLQSCIAVAKRNLAKPDVCYPNGRMSHDVERENLSRSEAELYDLMLEGEFDASGRFVRFTGPRDLDSATSLKK